MYVRIVVCVNGTALNITCAFLVLLRNKLSYLLTEYLISVSSE